MKTFKITSALAIATIAFAITFTACKKDKDDPGDDLKVGNDNAKFQADMDQSLNDINEAFSKSSLSFKVASPADVQAPWEPPCGSSADTSLLDTDKQITFTFDGTTSCNNRVRSGVIVAKLINGNRWQDQGAVLKITFNNFSVNHLSTSLLFTYNGTKTITNVNGGLVRNLSSGSGSVVHKVRGNITLTFDNGTERNWWIARRNTYDFNGGNPRFTSAGDTLVADSDSLLAVMPATTGGTNRFGNTFLYRAPIDIVSLANCGWDEPVQGQRIHFYNNRRVTVTFGVNQLGNSAGGDCAYGFKIEWLRYNGQIGTAVIAY